MHVEIYVEEPSAKTVLDDVGVAVGLERILGEEVGEEPRE